MRLVVVDLIGEDLPDGTFHIYSPNVPGFHVVSKGEKRTVYKKAHRILHETLARRVKEAGQSGEIRIHDALPVENFVPADLKRQLERNQNGSMPKQLVIQIE